MSALFPRTKVEDLSLSRMIIGTNWLAGWSHTSAAADAMIKERHADPKTIVPMLETFLAAGVDTLMGPIADLPAVMKAVKEAEQKSGKEIILVDTPIINVDDTEAARKEAKDLIRRGRELGAKMETVNQIIHAAKKPVMTIKPMAAGRTTPFVGLNFSWATIRGCDMVTVGCFNEREAAEDIEISLAALEHRAVNIAKRSSPNMKQDAFGN